MKTLIAIILMALAGACLAKPGDYRLNAEDNARFEAVVSQECDGFAAHLFGDTLKRAEVEYVAAVCKPEALIKIYERFDDIAAIPLSASLNNVLKNDSDQKINLLNKMGVKTGEIVAEYYLGMNAE
ncbi:hypothetical protein ACOIKJ_004837 [Escherichia coli]